jgi:hypothetical protein
MNPAKIRTWAGQDRVSERAGIIHRAGLKKQARKASGFGPSNFAWAAAS